MPNSSEPTNEPISTATSPLMSGLMSDLKTPSLPGLPSALKKASKKLANKHRPRKDAALARFLKGTGIKPSQVEIAPNLTSYFPNKKLVIESIRFSQESVVADFLKVYDSTPACDRKQISFEAIALKARVDFSALLGAMMFSFRDMQRNKSALIAMEAHPDVVAKTAKFAKERKGVQDRKMIHEAVGFLPTPKGQSINLNFPGSKDEGPEAGEQTAPEVDELFPMITNRQEKWQADRSRMLEGGN